MRCIREVGEIPEDLPSPRVAMGTFDGVHLGHLAVIRAILDLSASAGSAVVVTFEPHPHEILTPERPVWRLTDLDEKLILLSRIGVDLVIALPFGHEMAGMDAEAFFPGILGKLKMESLVVGYNFSAGRGRGGGLSTLTSIGNREGFGVTIIPPVLHEGVPLSSTRIRDAVWRGMISSANAMLGHPYLISGRVVSGGGRGQSLGYPTANLACGHPKKLVPADGVYAVRVRLRDRVLPGIMNVGRRPTFGGGRRWLEVHLFDFRDEVYGEILWVDVVDRVRSEMAFADEDQLRAQISLDVEQAKRILRKAGCCVGS